jgi:hypothetical protein
MVITRLCVSGTWLRVCQDVHTCLKLSSCLTGQAAPRTEQEAQAGGWKKQLTSAFSGMILSRMGHDLSSGSGLGYTGAVSLQDSMSQHGAQHVTAGRIMHWRAMHRPQALSVRVCWACKGCCCQHS